MRHTRSSRRAIAGAGVIVMLFLGTAYSWSLFTQPLVYALKISTLQAGLPFQIATFCLGLGAVVGGRWQDRVGPRTVTIVGAGMWGLGLLLAGIGTPHLGLRWLVATYGVIGGFGNGMAYVTPVATVTKWFPEKRGLAGGIVVMGFGFGAFAYNLIVRAIPSYAVAAAHASAYADAMARAVKTGVAFDAARYPVAAGDLDAVCAVLIGSGIVFAVVGSACALLLRVPPPGYHVDGRTATSDAAETSFTPRDVLATPQFYLLWAMLFLNVTAGITIISNAVPIVRELTGVDADAAATMYGCIAIFNGIGRFFWGAISDRIGRNATFATIFGLQSFVFFALGSLHGIVAVLAALSIVLLCFGGGFGTMPSFNADFFGTKYLGINYGMLLTAWGTAGLCGPAIGSYFRDATGGYSGALVPIAIVLLFATALPFVLTKPRGPARLRGLIAAETHGDFAEARS